MRVRESNKYKGGKNAAGTYQHIINLIPPHSIYIEPYVGSGAIFLRKLPADTSILNDIDARIAEKWRSAINDTNVHIYNEEGLEICKKFEALRQAFIYLDPPYLYTTRLGGSRKIYKHEAGDDAYHSKIMLWARQAKCNVMISGYDNNLYNVALNNWNTYSWQVRTRVGIATEKVWFNYPRPTILHDDRYLGINFREREKIKLKRERWMRKFEGLSEPIRMSILSRLNRKYNTHQ